MTAASDFSSSAARAAAAVVIDAASRRLLRMAGYVLLPANDNRRPGLPPAWRCKRRCWRERFEAAKVAAFAESGLIEIGPRHRWARLTEAGRKALGEQS